MKKRLFVTLFVVFAVFASLLPNLASAEMWNKYTLDAKLNFQRGFMEVKETMNFTNRTSKELNSIVFNVTPANFHAFNLQTATVDGTPVEAKMDGVVMELPLPKPLAPRLTTQIQMEFTLEIPQQGGRFGMNDRVLTLGNWFPIAAIYHERDGWDRHKYNKFGDPFYTEVADFDVVLDVSSDVKVAHSGELISREGNVLRMKGTKLRDFAMTVSDRYTTRTAEVDGITVTTFYLPEHAPAGTLYMDATVHALQWLHKKLGRLPHKSLHVAEGVSASTEMVGQEYPGLVFISSSMADKASGMKSPLGYLVVHEIVHQWFYSLVGNDQINEPWLDESLATYLGYQILEMSPLTLSSPSVVAAGNSPVNSSIYDFRDEGSYSATTYGKGTVFLQELNAAMGDDNFYKMLRRFVELYRDKNATTRNFFGLAQSFSNTNLNSLIRKYFSYPEYKGDSAPTLDVKWPSQETWTGSMNIEFESNAQVQQATVDADGRVLLTQEDPSSPLSVDFSQLEDDEYVVHMTIRDGNGNYAQQGYRTKITNPRPTPVPQVEQKPKPKSSSGDIIEEVANLTKAAGDIDFGSIILYGGAGLGGLVVLVLIGVVIRFVSNRTPVKVEPMPKFKNDRVLEIKPMQPMQTDMPRPSLRQPPASSTPPFSTSTSSTVNPAPTPFNPLPTQSSYSSMPSNPISRNPTPVPSVRPSRSDDDGYGMRGIGELEELETTTRNDQMTSDREEGNRNARQDNQENAKGKDAPFLGDFWPNK